MSKKAFITGISGQDGSYLSEYLLSLGYEVYGIVRRHSVAENQSYRLEHLDGSIGSNIFYGDLLDSKSIDKILKEIQPDEIYNLAAQSHVRISFDIPQLTTETNSLGVLNLLESYKNNCPNARFYQASSSEMFGLSVDEDGFQREKTPMNPVSPYGCSKVFAYNITRHYRRAYGLKISNGILFNHESPRRGSNFVTSKVVKGLCSIKLGLQKELVLGNLDSYRDWGHSKDYVKAMHMILNHDTADDFVVSTMQTHSVRNMCDFLCDYLDIDNSCIKQDSKYLRAEELPYLKGDSTKIRTTLGWKPTYDFESLMKEMCDHWMLILQGKKSLL
jgi:GDPmannose 4,6-dehydratase